MKKHLPPHLVALLIVFVTSTLTLLSKDILYTLV